MKKPFPRKLLLLTVIVVLFSLLSYQIFAISLGSYLTCGYSIPPLDTTGEAAFAASNYQDAGYNGVYLCNCGASFIYSDLPSESIFHFTGHGTAAGNTISCYNGSTYSYLSSTGTNTSTNYYISNLSASSLSKMKVLLLNGCRTAIDPPTNSSSFLKVAYDKGAKCIIGFADDINVGQSNYWGTMFSYYLYLGKTVATAETSADADVLKQYSDLGGLQSRRNKGDTTIKIK